MVRKPRPPKRWYVPLEDPEYNRASRPITPEGLLVCRRCKKVKHITEFRTSGKTWYIGPKGEQYGLPSWYCKQCGLDLEAMSEALEAERLQTKIDTN